MTHTPLGTVGYPFPEFDDLTGGMRLGQLIVIASRPGAGKTTLLLQILRHAAFRQRKKAHLISLEMSEDDLWLRLLSGESAVPVKDFHTDTFTETRQDAVTAAQAEFDLGALTVEVCPELHTFQLRPEFGASVFAYNRGEFGIIGIDGVDQITDIGASRVSGVLKQRALDLGIPVVVTARYRKGFTKTSPLMEDADTVLVLHRPDTLDPDHHRAGEADIRIVKNRLGPPAVITVAHQLFWSRFHSLS